MTSTKRLQRKNAVSFIFFGYWEKFYYFFILSFQKQGHKIIIRTVSWYEAHLQNHLLCQGDRDIFVIFEISVVALICKSFLTFGEFSGCRKQYNVWDAAYQYAINSKGDCLFKTRKQIQNKFSLIKLSLHLQKSISHLQLTGKKYFTLLSPHLSSSTDNSWKASNSWGLFHCF